MLPTTKPKNARTKRLLKARAPQVHENPKTTLFLKGTTCSHLAYLALSDLHTLKRPLAIKFTKKNDIHPFESPSSLEFFSEKNDASLMVFAHSSKKRPHALTFVRLFQHKLLDMLELYIDADSLRTIEQFKTPTKPAMGLRPLLSFSGAVFESPITTPYTLAKSLFVDLFRGETSDKIDVTGLQYMIHISAREPESSESTDVHTNPPIHLRVYLLRTLRSGQKVPRVEVTEMGPRMDFRVGRHREADEQMWKEAMKTPKGTEARTKKNVDTDLMGDKLGRIHMGKQDLGKMQTRKMKGLKRSRDDVDGEDADTLVEEPVGKRERVVTDEE